jgi:protein-S-isoprenylcysteine O-methyltransferase Ste14
MLKAIVMINPDIVAVINIAVLGLIFLSNFLILKNRKPRKTASSKNEEPNDNEHKSHLLLQSSPPQIDLKRGIAGLGNWFVLLWMAIIIMFASNPVFYYDFYDIRDAMQTLGLLAAVTGALFFFWSRSIPADPNMSSSTRFGLYVKTSGPYKYLRHPQFLGLILTTIGTIFLMGNAIYFLLVVPGLIISFLAQIEVNEEAANKLYPEQYNEYVVRTPWKLIPYFI